MSIGDIVLHTPNVNIYESIVGKVFDVSEDKILVEFKHYDETIIKAFEEKELIVVKEYEYDN